jgi:HTH-type transcriptional regulator/antitoxin MqsA
VYATAGAPEFIGSVRKKLDLDQRQAGAIFGGGVNAFSRYETGKAEPSVALIKLLALLDRYPELLDEIRANDYSYALGA